MDYKELINSFDLKLETGIVKIKNLIFIFTISILLVGCLENSSSQSSVEFQAVGVPAEIILPGILQTGVNIQSISQLPSPLNGDSCDIDQILQWNGSTWICIGSPATLAGADDLGNHTATENLNLQTFQLVGEGGSSGLYVNNQGFVGLGTTAPEKILHVTGSNRDVIFESTAVLPEQKFDLEIRRSRKDNNGNVLSPVLDEDLIGAISFLGHDGRLAGNPFIGGGVDGLRHAFVAAQAAGDFSPTDKPTRLLFGTTQSGTAASEYRMVIADNGYVGIGLPGSPPVPSEMLHINGNGIIEGNLVVNGTFTNASDIRFKDDRKVIKNSLEKIKNLSGYEYVWNDKAGRNAGELAIGLIAQEVEAQFPVLVSIYKAGTDEEYRSVNYQGMIAPLVNAVKELDSSINYNSESIASLLETVENLDKENKLQKEENRKLRDEIDILNQKISNIESMVNKLK